MNGGQDLGGAHGYGAVVAETAEPPFHAGWERRAFALTIAMGATGCWSLDASRSAREDRPPVEYLSLGYYELWLAGVERLIVDRGLVGSDELVAGRSLRPPAEGVRKLAASEVESTLARGAPTARSATAPARFAPGDRVRARNEHPTTHTRLPRYVRGRVGTVERLHGCHVFPDASACGLAEDPRWLYTVAFDGRELWGSIAGPNVAVSIDAFEPYLEPA